MGRCSDPNRRVVQRRQDQLAREVGRPDRRDELDLQQPLARHSLQTRACQCVCVIRDDVPKESFGQPSVEQVLEHRCTAAGSRESPEALGDVPAHPTAAMVDEPRHLPHPDNRFSVNRFTFSKPQRTSCQRFSGRISAHRAACDEPCRARPRDRVQRRPSDYHHALGPAAAAAAGSNPRLTAGAGGA